MHDPDKPHCLPCPYKVPLERDKVEREYVDDGTRTVVDWLAPGGGCLRTVSKDEYERMLTDCFRGPAPWQVRT